MGIFVKLVEEVNNRVNWAIPSYEDEKKEYTRAANELQQFAKEHPQVKNLLNSNFVKDIHDRGEMVSFDQIQEVENTDYYNVNNIEDVEKLSKKYGREYQNIIDGLKTKQPMNMPIVLSIEDDWHTLIAGNTRMMVFKALGIVPNVWLVKIR
jgi:hypothetical protein